MACEQECVRSGSIQEPVGETDWFSLSACGKADRAGETVSRTEAVRRFVQAYDARTSGWRQCAADQLERRGDRERGNFLSSFDRNL